jgi:hypothetical protein
MKATGDGIDMEKMRRKKMKEKRIKWPMGPYTYWVLKGMKMGGGW